MKFYRNEEIEQIAEKRIEELKAALNRALAPPIPVELMAEHVLGLNILWDEIQENEGEVILAGLQAKERLVVMNQKRRLLFSKKPGLERFTQGHEFGHWDLFVDKATLDYPELFAQEASNRPIAFRSSGRGTIGVMKILREEPDAADAIRLILSRADEPDEARAVNRYASAITMPRKLVRYEAEKIDRTKWPPLYRLAEHFGVTISALVVRLQQLDLLYVGPNNRLFPSRAVGLGQHVLKF